MKEKNFLVYNLRDHLLSFYPHAFKVRFFLPGDNEVPQIKFFFSKSAIEKMIWFGGWLKKHDQCANIYLKEPSNVKVDGEFVMEMENFPVADHVGLLGARKILEKGLKRIDVVVFSSFSLEILDQSLFKQFLANDCKATFHCFEQNLLDIKRPEMLEVKTQVLAPFSM